MTLTEGSYSQHVWYFSVHSRFKIPFGTVYCFLGVIGLEQLVTPGNTWSLSIVFGCVGGLALDQPQLFGGAHVAQLASPRHGVHYSEAAPHALPERLDTIQDVHVATPGHTW